MSTNLTNSLNDVFSPRRARGISTLALGCGPSVGKLYALGIDSRVHVYNPYGAAGVPLGYEVESEEAKDGVVAAYSETFSHPRMATNSFYVRIGISPCGRWLASGSTGGSAYLFDISQSQYPRRAGHAVNNTRRWEGIQLPGQRGEVGALDWGYETLATCADDGTVRIWRPELETVSKCWESEVFGIGRMSRTELMRPKWCWADMDGVAD
jgi:denticleless